jgi:hypothetical protein
MPCMSRRDPVSPRVSPRISCSGCLLNLPNSQWLLDPASRKWLLARIHSLLCSAADADSRRPGQTPLRQSSSFVRVFGRGGVGVLGIAANAPRRLHMFRAVNTRPTASICSCSMSPEIQPWCCCNCSPLQPCSAHQGRHNIRAAATYPHYGCSTAHSRARASKGRKACRFRVPHG